ncbi:MAG: sulfite exporter TauE/SafE family protein [Prevotellaceae bacterium]|nr:sulfite exporter TauE/SafE family protein [Prevotellaceae bacterium]
MDIQLLTLILFAGAVCAGLLGALTGLGGGVIVIPLLTLGLGFDMRYAVGTALITSIATSSGAATAYIREGITNIRIGMFLEIATTLGAVCGAMVAIYLPTGFIAVIYGVVLVFSAAMIVRKKNADGNVAAPDSPLAKRLKLNGTYPTANGTVSYKVRKVMGGFSMMGLAGILSGILGIGSGALKVLAMDTVMKIPFKVSTTTSNFMVGVTAAASAVIYLQRGYIDPGLALPVIPGVLTGAFFGSKILMKANVKILRIIFAILICFLSIQMIYNGITGRI